MILSKSFPTSSNRQIGLYGEGTPVCLPLFGRKTTLAFFQTGGNIPCLRQLLYNRPRRPDRTVRTSTQTRSGIPSGPGAFILDPSFFMAPANCPRNLQFLTSCGEFTRNGFFPPTLWVLPVVSDKDSQYLIEDLGFQGLRHWGRPWTELIQYHSV